MRNVIGGIVAATAVFAPVAVTAAEVPAAAPAPVAALVEQVKIPYQQFTLANGLRVIVHTDRKTPVVAVGVWYHIGSKDEPAGKTGFAHLFEHLMFGGSENVADFDRTMEDIGKTQDNGSTWYDRTNYFENVPTPALATALFVESDRMGHLLGAVSQAKLDIQRGVVQNEKRQGDNRPFGLVDYAIGDALFPAGHPYRHNTIGSMADLDAASLADVQGWFRANYGANNAVLVLAGDIDAATARPLVEKYFGDIPRGPAPVRYSAAVPVRTATTRGTLTDAVANPRIYRTYVLPGRTDAAAPLVDVAATILAGGDSSRLYTDLVREHQLAVAVSGGVQAFEKVSMAQFVVDVKPGTDPAKVEARMDAVFAEFLKNGPTADEVQRVATQAVAQTIRGLELVGGFGGKGVTLAEGAVYAGDADYYKTELRRYAEATPASVHAAARRWLAGGEHRLTVTPGARVAAADAVPVKAAAATLTAPPRGAPRPPPPPVTATPDLTFPAVERATLSNGIQVTLARRETVPVVRVMLSFDAGNAADDRAHPGLQDVMLDMLDEGTARRSGPEITRESERLGASIGASAGLDRTRVSLNALKPNLAPSLDLFADVVRNPRFDAADLERVRGQALAGIAQELQDPGAIGQRALNPELYGAAHPYGMPGTGSGTAAGIAGITRGDLSSFHRRWLRPDNAQLFVVGDITMAELQPLLESSLGGWRADPAVAKGSKVFPPLAVTPPSQIILIDRPGAAQSYIRAAMLLPLTGRDDPFALRVANDLIGGQFTSRLNADLREAKGWSYGVRSGLGEASAQSLYVVSAPVQTDRTGESIAAIVADFAALKAARPFDAEELTKVVNSNVRGLPSEFENGGGVLAAIERNAVLGRPDDYYTRLTARYRALTTADLNTAAAGLDAARLTWIVVGDRKLVEPQLAKLGIPVVVRPAA